MSSSLAEEEETWGKIFNSAIPQVDVRRPQQVFGTAQYVAAEVLVSYFARYLFKVEKRTLLELTAIHAVSVPFIGGLSAFVSDNHILTYEAPITDVVADGAKGIPAVFAAQYICNTALSGLHAQKLNFKDILVTAAAKLITRPLVSVLYPYFGDTFRTNLDIVEEVVSRQHSASRLNMD